MTQNKLLALAAVVLGLLAFIVGAPHSRQMKHIDANDLTEFARQIENEEDHVLPGELASAIMSKDQSFILYDLRDSTAYNSYHIPTAVRTDIDSLLKSPTHSADSIVLYSEGGTHASQAWVLLRVAGYTRVRTLKNGLQAWEDEILHPAVVDNSDSSHSIVARSIFFGGAAVMPPDSAKHSVQKPANVITQARKKSPPPPNNMKEEERSREGC